jgi:hypothetical protein
VFEKEPQCPIGFQLVGTTAKTCVNTNPLVSGTAQTLGVNISSDSSKTATDTRDSDAISRFASASSQALRETKTFEIDGRVVSEEEFLLYKKQREEFNRQLQLGLIIACTVIGAVLLFVLWFRKLRGK